MSSMLPTVLMQFAGQSPVWIVLLVGIVLGLVYAGRYPGPSICVLIACSVLLLSGVGLMLAQFYFIHGSAAAGRRPVDIGRIMTVLAVGGAVIRAAAYGLLITAVFIGRTQHLAGKADALPMR